MPLANQQEANLIMSTIEMAQLLAGLAILRLGSTANLLDLLN